MITTRKIFQKKTALPLVFALAFALALTSCDGSGSPASGGGGGGPADFGNPFHGTWSRTVPAGDFTLTITATSATEGIWEAIGRDAPGGIGDNGIFVKRDATPIAADISANFHRSLRWELSSGDGAQTLTWPAVPPSTDHWVFERAP